MNTANRQITQSAWVFGKNLRGEATGLVVTDLFGDLRCLRDATGSTSSMPSAWQRFTTGLAFIGWDVNGVPRSSRTVNEAVSQKISPMSSEGCISGCAVRAAFLRRWEHTVLKNLGQPKQTTQKKEANI
jgi:hypothetical protein